MYGVEHGHGWIEATPQRSRWRKTKKKKHRKWEGEPDDRGGQLQTVVWFWRTEASPILSFLIHAVRWGATIPEGRQEPSAIWEEGKIQKKQKKEKSTEFRLLWNLKEEKENYWVDFSMKKCVYLIIESFRRKNQSRKLPQPVSGNHQLQRKVLEPSAHTVRHTNPHTPKRGHRSSRNPTPPKKDSETFTPTTTAYEAVLHCWQKLKKYWQECWTLCQLKSTNNDPKYTSSHDAISVRK